MLGGGQDWDAAVEYSDIIDAHTHAHAVVHTHTHRMGQTLAQSNGSMKDTKPVVGIGKMCVCVCVCVSQKACVRLSCGLGVKLEPSII